MTNKPTGRPPGSGQGRDIRVRFTVNAKEDATIRKRAAQAGIPIAEFIRRRVLAD